MSNPEPPQPITSGITAWGNSSLAPTGLATLIAALHSRPFQGRPMVFVPVLLFASYANLQGFRKDGAGITAAASGAYALLALRRRPRPHRTTALLSRFSARGVVRGAAVGLAAANALAGGWVYATADRESETRERRENPRWVG